MSAAILNHTKDGVLHFGQKVRAKFRTGSLMAARELTNLKLPYPKFKRGQQTANVTVEVWSRDI